MPLTTVSPGLLRSVVRTDVTRTSPHPTVLTSPLDSIDPATPSDIAVGAASQGGPKGSPTRGILARV